MSTCRNDRVIWLIAVFVSILVAQPNASHAQRNKGAAIAIGILSVIGLGALLANSARAGPTPPPPLPGRPRDKPEPGQRHKQATDTAIVGPSLLPDNQTARAPEPRPQPNLMVLRSQIALAKIGIDPGPADGLLGARTRRAIARFQRNLGQNPTGKLTTEQRQLLWEAGL